MKCLHCVRVISQPNSSTIKTLRPHKRINTKQVPDSTSVVSRFSVRLLNNRQITSRRNSREEHNAIVLLSCLDMFLLK